MEIKSQQLTTQSLFIIISFMRVSHRKWFNRKGVTCCLDEDGSELKQITIHPQLSSDYKKRGDLNQLCNLALYSYAVAQ